MVSCNFHLETVMDKNEKAAQSFQGVMMGQSCFLFCAWKSSVNAHYEGQELLLMLSEV